MCLVFRGRLLQPSQRSPLREHIDKDRAEELALKHEVCLLQNSLRNRDKDVEELSAKASRQSSRYDELWSAHGVLLEEAQTLCSQVITLSLGSRVKSFGGCHGSGSSDPRDLVTDLRVRVASRGGR